MNREEMDLQLELDRRDVESRDMFAASALQGLLAFPHHDGFQFPPPSHLPPEVANLAYCFADAMMKRRAM